MQNPNQPIKAIISPEQIFQFMCDAQDQRIKEIRLEDAIRRLSMDVSTLNLN